MLKSGPAGPRGHTHLPITRMDQDKLLLHPESNATLGPSLPVGTARRSVCISLGGARGVSACELSPTRAQSQQARMLSQLQRWLKGGTG